MQGETPAVAGTEALAQYVLFTNPVLLLSKFMKDCPESPGVWVKESMVDNIECLKSLQLEVGPVTQTTQTCTLPLLSQSWRRSSQGSSSTGRLRVGFALVSASSAGAAGPSVSSAGAAGPSASSAGAAGPSASSAGAAGPSARFYSVAEIKKPGKLVLAGSSPPTPLGLIDLYAKVPADSLSTSVRIMLDQLWTYMVLTGVEFGWLSCYYFTWLAWRPSDHPERMCLSRPYHHDVDGDDGVTVMGALSWLQEQVVARLDRRHCTAPYILPPPTNYHRDDSTDKDGYVSPPDDGGHSPGDKDYPHPEGEGRLKR